MKISRFCPFAALILTFFTSSLQAARLPETEQPFQSAFVAPEAGDLPLWDMAAWLGIGAALGWLLFLLSVSLMVRQEGSRVAVRK